MQEGLRRQELSEKVEMLRGLGHLMKALLRIDLIHKISSKFNKRGSNQFPTEFPRASGDRVPNLNLRREKVLINQTRSQLVDSMVKSTIVSALRGRIIALVVSRMVTK